MAAAWKVFYSYSHEDAPYRGELGAFLAPLRHAGRLVEWYDREIMPGSRWETEIFARLDAADLIVFLVSKSFLASDYCFGVEMERSFQRLKTGGVMLLPILLGPCLWKESRFSEIQCLPRDARPVLSWPSRDEALGQIASEISDLVKTSPPTNASPIAESANAAGDLSIVRAQVLAYARLYERVRQQMQSSDERTRKMEEVFRRMQSLVMASFPLLPELATSPSPGEKLAAIAILQTLANVEYLPFLGKAVRSEKPFVAYHALCALDFAVSALEPRFYPQLKATLDDAAGALAQLDHDSGRFAVLTRARKSLAAAMSMAVASA